jgi:hypothetical protein
MCFWSWMVLLLSVEIVVPSNLMAPPTEVLSFFGTLAWESQILHLMVT